MLVTHDPHRTSRLYAFGLGLKRTSQGASVTRRGECVLLHLAFGLLDLLLEELLLGGRQRI